MQDNEHDEPADPTGPQRPVTSPDLARPPSRRALWATVVGATVAALVGSVLLIHPDSTPQAVAPPAPSAAPEGDTGSDPAVAPVAAVVAAAPGDDAGVQRWLKARETLQIELVNAASAVAKLDPARARGTDPACTRLTAVTTALTIFAAAPEARMDQLSKAGLGKLTEAAKACLAGDVPAAVAAAKAGLLERADALNALDDLLEGK